MSVFVVYLELEGCCHSTHTGILGLRLHLSWHCQALGC